MLNQGSQKADQTRSDSVLRPSPPTSPSTQSANHTNQIINKRFKLSTFRNSFTTSIMSFKPVTKYWSGLAKEIHSCGSWFQKGTVHIPPFTVDGRTLLFPLTPDTCQQLIQGAEQAPFGRGTETVHDEAVRKGWQIDGSRLAFYPPGQNFLDAFTKELQSKMALPPIELVLYKLLIYEAGGHFQPHRDTLRGTRHIGSVIVSLPVEHGSQCVGGELVVTGPGPLSVNVETWDGLTEGFMSSYAAFFTDCVHELKPVESGYRVALAFEMHHRPPPTTEGTESAAEQAAVVSLPAVTVSEAWVEKCKQFVNAALSNGRHTLVIPLLHKYGEIKDPVSQLKGADLVLYQIMLKEYSANCSIHVDSFEIQQEFYAFECKGYDESEDSISFGRISVDKVYEKDPFVINVSEGTIHDLVVEGDDEDEDEENRDDGDAEEEVAYERLPSKPVNGEDFPFEMEAWYLYSRDTVYLCNAEIEDTRQANEYTGNEAAPMMNRYRSVCLQLQLLSAGGDSAASNKKRRAYHYW